MNALGAWHSIYFARETHRAVDHAGDYHASHDKIWDYTPAGEQAGCRFNHDLFGYETDEFDMPVPVPRGELLGQGAASKTRFSVRSALMARFGEQLNMDNWSGNVCLECNGVSPAPSRDFHHVFCSASCATKSFDHFTDFCRLAPNG